MALIETSLFSAIDQNFKSMGAWLNDNAKKQSLGTIYPNPTYEYSYYDWNQTIETKKISLSQVEDNDTLNFVAGYSGSIVGQSDEICPQGMIVFTETGFKQFISM